MKAHEEPVEILLVEDNEADIELAREAFTSCKVKHNLHFAVDAEQAISFLTRNSGFEDAVRPHLVFLDLNLPGTDGREVLNHIKSSTHLKTIPVVIMTSSDAEEDIARSFELQANSYIKKPVTMDGFLKVTRAIDDFWLSVVRWPSN